ncbi:sortase family protein [Leifsonia aquatica]|uniref:class F sortase n=1 Tax=Leifsonia aquatica TaxID=144185 RepID=UPI003830EE82
MSERRRHRASARRRSRRLGVPRIVLLSLLGIVAIVAATYTVSTYLHEQTFPKDMNGQPVVVESVASPKNHAVPQVDGRTLRVPSRKLTVPLGELDQVDGVIDPPGFASAYLVRNHGATLGNAADGTVYVVMHSCRGGATCPGNYLIDVASGQASVPNGADVYVAGLHYRVTGSHSVYKPDVSSDAEIWQNTPGKLVLLTCLQVPAQTKSVDNMVITAQLVS